MLYYMLFLIFFKEIHVACKNAGSAIFNHDQLHAACWYKDDLAKLQARKTFEEIIPPLVNPEKINTKYVRDTLKYFQHALRFIRVGVDNRTAKILDEALLDTIGAHLNKEILPAMRFAYYAGYVPYKHVRKAHDFFDNIKLNLNTQGVGWKRPTRDVWSQWSHLNVSKIIVGTGKFLDPCRCLVTKRDINNCIHLPSPKLDDKKTPSAVSLPFKSEGLVSLTAPSAENVLLKYYTTASRCILHSSPPNCRHADFVNFNIGLWQWMKREVAPHLLDDKLFTAYGGVLRIAAAVQNYGKELTRRNLYDCQKETSKKWNPWEALTQSYIYINADWTPALYVATVFCIAVLICMIQMFYNYIFDELACRCRQMPKKCNPCYMAYPTVDSTFTAGLSQQNTVFSNNEIRRKDNSKSDLSKKASTSQKVFDLNDNTEKIMLIKHSTSDYTDDEPSITRRDIDRNCQSKLGISAKELKLKTPPKIETSIAQLTIDKQRTPRSDKIASKPMYSTRKFINSDEDLCDVRKLSESVCSISDESTSCSTSDKSISYTSSKSRSQRLRRAWPRRVISRNSQRNVQFSGRLESDGQSFTTTSRH